ncbi:MAG: adenylyltransferase/cytidyltransferase family protein, partial [Nanoarchaeota archaeon]
MPAALNPIHYGHIGVMKFSLYFLDEVHVYVGRRNKGDRLPRELRIECLEETIQKENLDRIRIKEA